MAKRQADAYQGDDQYGQVTVDDDSTDDTNKTRRNMGDYDDDDMPPGAQGPGEHPHTRPENRMTGDHPHQDRRRR